MGMLLKIVQTFPLPLTLKITSTATLSRYNFPKLLMIVINLIHNKPIIKGPRYFIFILTICHVAYQCFSYANGVYFGGSRLISVSPEYSFQQFLSYTILLYSTSFSLPKSQSQ